ncbi:Nramp family divalent metal transporter [Thalassotalea agarivorans]|uniref:NRAMP (Natural resistance-associated macrophage protein) metal ion transporters n=1 Tax=Thalassotalea agarivorans TaxID=349064 RepID=A0A1I0G982_THASX|nr:Nramp family divalent metal transporter [Thalassotalea agarivorans]SET66645.1 NRAMP (natural resistance-associated macrophage protein) metal ion transporters [Thalassotalea agarivorans]
MSFWKKFGPGLLVTAAFIGPGTITTASVAGANYGYALLWAVFFSLILTFTLQEMAARLSLVTKQSLAHTLTQAFNHKIIQYLVAFLVISAIGIGNAAYEAGNITGAAWSLASVTSLDSQWWTLIIGSSAALLLWFGKYKALERVLVGFVMLMSLVFIATCIAVAPDLGGIAKGIFRPTIPDGALLSAIALIGTTVVPYNLFLHASAAREKWRNQSDIETAINESRIDTAGAIFLGGLITMAIVATAAVGFFQGETTLVMQNISQQLVPMLGEYADEVFAVGLFSAGMTSAIAAPLAASFAVCGALGKPLDFQHPLFRSVWLIVLVVGTFFAFVGSKPLTAILFAQAMNALLLPIIALFLLVVMNKRSVLGQYVNSSKNNFIAVIMVATVTGLALYKISTLIG